MAEFRDREHFVPIRRSELVALLLAQLPDAESGSFTRFSQLLCDRVHLEFYKLLERLKDDYAPFDPDTDTRTMYRVEGPQRAAREEGLFRAFERLLERANFVRLPNEQVVASQNDRSHWGVAMSIDLDAFDRFAMFVRGKTTGKRVLRSWRTFFRSRSIEVEIFQRLVVILKQRPHPRLGPEPDTRSVFLKLFKDIPTLDLEMLVPGAKMSMPKVERGKLGLSVVSGIVLLAWQLLRPLFTIAKAAAGGAVAYGPLGIIGALFGYGYRQYYGYQFSVRTYGLRLAQSLYYQNLDNNAGVLHRLLDSAEEQDAREALLAYFYLWKFGGERGLTAAELDDLIESELERTAGIKVDFEIEDALRKVVRVGLCRREGDRIIATPIDAAIALLSELPVEPVFSREVIDHDPRTVDFPAGTRHRDVGRSPGVRAGEVSQGPGGSQHRPAALPGA